MNRYLRKYSKKGVNNMNERTERARPPRHPARGRESGDSRRRTYSPGKRDSRDGRDSRDRRSGGRRYSSRPPRRDDRYRRDDRRRDDRRSGGPPRDDRPRREQVAFEDTAPEPLPEGAAPPLVKSREVVVPGEVLCTGLDYLPSNGTFRRGEAIVASVLGIVRFKGRLVSIIPLAGGYLPMLGDVIVGRVMDILMTGWRLEINSAYSAVLSITNTTGYIRKGEDLTKYYKIGDYVVTQIVQVTSQNLIDVTMKGRGFRNLKGGRVIKVSPNKVPRIIGKAGSMVEQIKRLTGCDIVVGQNGVVWLQGHPRNELVVVDVIRKIEAEAHTSGLTQRAIDFLNKRMAEFGTAVAEELKPVPAATPTPAVTPPPAATPQPTQTLPPPPPPEKPEEVKEEKEVKKPGMKMREPTIDDALLELEEEPKKEPKKGLKKKPIKKGGK